MRAPGRRETAGNLALVAALSLACLGAAGAKAVKAPDPYDPGDLWADKTVITELGEAEKALDAELKRIPKRPRILLSSREFAFEAALDDEREILKGAMPGADETFIRASAASTATGAFAFYEPLKNTVHILPDNFVAVARFRKDRQFLTREFLRMVLIHELVHAYDCQERGLQTLRESIRKPEQFKILSAVSEGHAQYVTRHIMEKMGRLDQFEAFSDAVFSSYKEDSDPGERFLRSRAAANGRFGYVNGLDFYLGLEKLGKPELLSEPFNRLPESVSVILHPERFASPPERPAALDLSVVVRREIADVEPHWRVVPIPSDEHTVLSATSTLLDADRVGALLANFVSSASAAGHPAPPTTRAEARTMLETGSFRQAVVCTAVQMTDEESAKRLLNMWHALTGAQEKAFSAGGKVKTPVLKDGPITVGGNLDNFRHTRLFDDGGHVVSEASIFFRRKAIVADCEFFSSPRKDDELSDVVDSFVNELTAAEQ